MKAILIRALPTGVRNDLRLVRNRVRRFYVRHRYAFEPADIARALARCGVRETDAVLVHCSFSDFDGFRGSAPELIAALRSCVRNGTLLMPTSSFRGSAVTHARTATMFDPQRTPSRLGLLTEVFRRSPGVERSLHPTHSVAALGVHAQDMLANHHLADTPCGRGTPYYRLWERDGKIVLLNTTIGSLAFYHTVEEILEPRLPRSPFTDERFRMRIHTPQGVVDSAAMRLYDPALSARRDLQPLKAELQQRGHWHETRVRNVPITVLGARHILEAAEALTDRKVWCYRFDSQPSHDAR